MPQLTIYQYAAEAMQSIVEELIELAGSTNGFTSPDEEHWQDERVATLLLCGKGVPVDALPPPAERGRTWLSRAALPFRLQKAATGILYEKLSAFTDTLIDDALTQTGGLSEVTPGWIAANPRFLPVLMHAVGMFSKQELVELVGQVSDARISTPASKRLAKLVESAGGQMATAEQIRERIKATAEGIVRDLVGRLLLEQFVASGLDKARVPYRREKEYEALSGVVYDFRADFVVPDENSPKPFVEVRRSSSRHASLYAKDKMFSAINWKGRHRDCVGVLVVDGPWTVTSLEIMTKVFDYVVPISEVPQTATRIRAYLDGDSAVLRWLVRFEIKRHQAAS